MSSVVNVKNLLDPELRPVLDAFELPTVDAEGVAAMRSASFASPELSDAVTRTDHVVPGDPPVPVRVHRSTDAVGLLPAIITIHGGGYVIGSYDMDSPLLDRWCPGSRGRRRLRRVSPRARDALSRARSTTAMPRCAGRTTTRATLASTRTASASTGSVPVVGSPPRWPCSLVIAAKFRLRSRCSTARCSTTVSRRPPSKRTASTCGPRAPTNSAGAPTSVLSTGPTRCPAYAAAARAADLAGLPPTCVVVGSIDGFRDEDIDYAERLNQAGVPCELHVIAGLPHAYLLVPGAAAVELARHCMDDWLARQLAHLRAG